VTRYLLQIEFRYPRVDRGPGSQTVTLGVFDTFSDAALEGNAALKELEKTFPLHSFPDGSQAKPERFSKHGGPFGTANNLVTNLAYLKTPFQFFAKITSLQSPELMSVVQDVIREVREYREYRDSDKSED